MSAFTIHSIPGSPFGRAVLAALHEKGVPCRFSTVTLGALRAPEHLARHPFGRVPVLEHDGVVLDVGRLNQVTASAGTAVVGAGARLIDVYGGLAGHGVTIPAGSCPTVGAAGFRFDHPRGGADAPAGG